MLFVLKKIISAFLLPPGSFIIVLIAFGIRFFFSRRRSCGIFVMTMGFLLWGMSLGPVSNYLMKGLEHGITIPERIQGDVIILLGAGAYDGVRDLTGIGTPSDDMMSRLVTAVRVQKRTGAPVIVSGGALRKTDTPESWIARRFLRDLGVPSGKIIIEDRSKDTGENARYVAELCARHGFRHPLLVTAAYHMKRSLLIFHRYRLTVTPLPSSLRYDSRNDIKYNTFLPSIKNLSATVLALNEQLGLLYYRWAPLQGTENIPATPGQPEPDRTNKDRTRISR